MPQARPSMHLSHTDMHKYARPCKPGLTFIVAHSPYPSYAHTRPLQGQRAVHAHSETALTHATRARTPPQQIPLRRTCKHTRKNLHLDRGKRSCASSSLWSALPRRTSGDRVCAAPPPWPSPAADAGVVLFKYGPPLAAVAPNLSSGDGCKVPLAPAYAATGGIVWECAVQPACPVLPGLEAVGKPASMNVRGAARGSPPRGAAAPSLPASMGGAGAPSRVEGARPLAGRWVTPAGCRPL